MANIKSAKKRVIVNRTKAERNKAIKSKVKTAIKKVDAAIAAKDKEAAMDKVKELREALNGNDIDEIKKVKDELQEKTMSLATKVYEEAAKTAEANKNNDSSDKNDGAEEAEFVNKD